MYRDLPSVEAHQYPLLKATILSCYRYSLPARAQQYHDWHYDPGRPVRPQVNDLARRTRRWLVEEEGPALLERIILDRCIRDLPPGAKRYVAEQGPRSVENVIAMLENHQTTQEMMRASRSGPSGPATAVIHTRTGRASLPPTCVTPRPGRGPARGPRADMAPTEPLTGEGRMAVFCVWPGRTPRPRVPRPG